MSIAIYNKTLITMGGIMLVTALQMSIKVKSDL